MSSLLQGLASLKFTLAGLILLTLACAVVYQQATPTGTLLTVPLALLALNLVAAIATTAKLRTQLPLLVFHLSLLAIVVLVGAGRLTYLKGHVELADGVPFAGVLAGEERGPLHFGGIERLRFVSEGFTIDYAPTVQREATRNRVAWPDAAGLWQRQVIGDQTPLVLQGYRFYTSFNKGFAPTFQWTPAGGEPLLGAVHLPAYPAHEYNQARTWSPPGSAEVLWFMLSFDDLILDPSRRSEFRLPNDYRLVVRAGDARHEMRPGEALRLPGGTLQFLGLRAWMGYTVFYDWTLSWLMAASAVAVLSLGYHFWRKFSLSAWDA